MVLVLRKILRAMRCVITVTVLAACDTVEGQTIDIFEYQR